MERHALLIGVSEFTDKRLARLNAPTNDVLALRDILQDESRGGFGSVELSINDDYVAMRDHLLHFFQDRAPDDLLLLYYSGHGILGRGNRLFLATTGSDLDVPRNRSVSAREIREYIEECRAERQIVILDCCHSGAFAEYTKAAVLPPAVTEETFARADTGLYVLTASDALQFAWDGAELRRGDVAVDSFSQFTLWLVEGLGEGKAAPDKEEITIDALYHYLYRRAHTTGAASIPQRFVHGGVGDLVIGRNPNRLVGAAKKPVILLGIASNIIGDPEKNAVLTQNIIKEASVRGVRTLESSFASQYNSTSAVLRELRFMISKYDSYILVIGRQLFSNMQNDNENLLKSAYHCAFYNGKETYLFMPEELSKEKEAQDPKISRLIDEASSRCTFKDDLDCLYRFTHWLDELLRTRPLYTADILLAPTT